MKVNLGKPVFIYEIDPKNAEEAEQNFWQKIIPLMVEAKSKKKSA